MATNIYISEDKSNFRKCLGESPEEFLMEAGRIENRHSKLAEDGYEDYGMTVKSCSIPHSGRFVDSEVFSFVPGFDRENYRKVVKNFFVQMKDFISAYSTIDSEGAESLNDFYNSWCDHYQNYADDLNKYGKSLTIPNPTKIQKVFVDAYTRSLNTTSQAQKKKEFDSAYLMIQDSLALSYATNIMSTCEGNLSLTPRNTSTYGKTKN